MAPSPPQADIGAMTTADQAIGSRAIDTLGPFNARWHVREEFLRVLRLLHGQLRLQRSRGRSPFGDVVHGLVIEEGEAEGLVAQLHQRLSGRATSAGGSDADKARPNFRIELAGASRAALPLPQVASRFELTTAEYDALILALGVEWDSRFGRLISYLNDHVANTRPTIGLALALSAAEGSDAAPSAAAFLGRPCVRDGLLVIEGDGPAPGRCIRVAHEVALRLFGEAEGGKSRVAVEPVALGSLQRLVLEDHTRRALSAWCTGVRRSQQGSVLLLSGAKGSGRRTVAWACASEIGRPMVVVRMTGEDPTDLIREGRREARWHQAALCVALDEMDDAGARVLWADLAGVECPVFVTGGSAVIDRVLDAGGSGAAVVRVGEPDLAARVAIWRRLLPPGSGIADHDIDDLATRFRFGPARIARSIARARSSLALAPALERRLDRDRLNVACREVGSAAMSRLAEALPLPYRLRDLVVPYEIQRELALALAWVAHGRTVLDTWGFGARLSSGKGLTALFSGPPGCGKTMAAQALARELGVELYRVDLSRVLSKWIGETERQLAQLFDEAEMSGCALFFDEADALFGKRSEVKDAHDRYANVEIGYLLQRMEQYSGITVLGTNRPADLDEAFLRRFHVNLQFTMPGEPDRLHIWRGIFPPAAALEVDLDLAQVAKAFDLSGGEIRNAALAAAYIAASEPSPIGTRHVWQAAIREMKKAGRVPGEGVLRETSARPAERA